MLDRALVPMTVALPKGRVLEQALAALAEAGLPLELGGGDRAMRHHSEVGSAVLMRNADVPTYVELGVADIGVVGKDVLMESGAAVYEPVDLGFAACRLSLIRPKGAEGPIRRVATKYPRVAARYLHGRGSQAEVVALKGNVELACLTGLADAVVDVVETGATLLANDLVEIDRIAHSSARLVVNRAALKLRAAAFAPFIERLRAGAAAAAG